MKLLDFIETIERALGKKAKRNYLDMQPGDVPRTFASADLLERLTGYRPHTSIDDGVARSSTGIARSLCSRRIGVLSGGPYFLLAERKLCAESPSKTGVM